ncbi:endo alpha-1,4 polygalactosaminidase [Streptomyces carminius]|uniref:endo alpha-1,4 polygalactosaminidase n=1 Tax=Streptomyces carminius TaxID=2665496 RepID=UPI001E2AA72C|nr:endo alpha-1,4 polygalactosaminidase [Streptomyces carminius]
MHAKPARTARKSAVAVAAGAVLAVLGVAVAQAGGTGGTDEPERSPAAQQPRELRLPPAGAGFDYQIGGGYELPEGVEVISRDREDDPAPDAYNICYVNAFQVQPGEQDDWDADLILRDGNGDPVIDGGWDEPLLDISTADKRARVAEKVGDWFDGCAADGFDAVEPDNYDSFLRSAGLTTQEHALELMKLLAGRAHAAGLAIAQKNTLELAPHREEIGLDFAVVEECGQWEECGDFTEWFGDRVYVIEYEAAGMAWACDNFGDTLGIVQRDEYAVPADHPDHFRAVCPRP